LEVIGLFDFSIVLYMLFFSPLAICVAYMDYDKSVFVPLYFFPITWHKRTLYKKTTCIIIFWWQVFVFVLSVDVQHTERNALLYRAYTNIQWCRSVRRTLLGGEVLPKCGDTSATLRHHNLVPNCPGAEVSRERPYIPAMWNTSCWCSVYASVINWPSQTPHMKALSDPIGRLFTSSSDIFYAT